MTRPVHDVPTDACDAGAAEAPTIDTAPGLAPLPLRRALPHFQAAAAVKRAITEGAGEMEPMRIDDADAVAEYVASLKK